MLGRPKNRRKPSEARPQLPAINWRYLGLWVLALAGIAAAGCAVSWAFDQPIETVAVEGRFQRVAPVDVERVVKEKVHGAGLLSADLAAVRRAIHTLAWVDAVSVRSEEHTSELQSRRDLVCRLLLEKNNEKHRNY